MSVNLEPGRKAKHGGYTYLTTGKLPEHRKYIESYLTAARMGIIHDLGPTEEDLTTAQMILIDRVVTKLGVIRCIEEHIRETSVMKGDRLSASLRESYLAYNNSIRLSLQALGLDKRQKEGILAPYEIVEEENGNNKRTK
jgi:hypothetical protein